jgi:hypothetical protein
MFGISLGELVVIAAVGLMLIGVPLAIVLFIVHGKKR